MLLSIHKGVIAWVKGPIDPNAGYLGEVYAWLWLFL